MPRLTYFGRDRRHVLYTAKNQAVMVDTKYLTASVLAGDKAKDAEISRPWSASSSEPDSLIGEIAEGALLAAGQSGVPDVLSSTRRGHTIPSRVRETAKRVLADKSLSPMSRMAATILGEGGQIPGSDVFMIHRFFEGTTPEEAGPVKWAAWGGNDGRSWAAGLANRLEYDSVTADAGAFETPSLADALPDVEEGRALWGRVVSHGLVDSVFQHRNGTWYCWGNATWEPVTAAPEPRVELDDESAMYACASLFDMPDKPVDLRHLDPTEWLVADASLPSVDWRAIRHAMSAAADDGEYTPEERSENASAQLRDANGRFAKVGDSGLMKQSGIRGEIETVNEEGNQLIVSGEDGNSYMIDPKEFEIDGGGGDDASTQTGKPDPNLVVDMPDFSKILGQPRATKTTPKGFLGKVLQPMGPRQLKDVIGDYESFIHKERQRRANDFKGGTGWRESRALTDKERKERRQTRRDRDRAIETYEDFFKKYGSKRKKNTTAAAIEEEEEAAGPVLAPEGEATGALSPDDSDVKPLYLAIVDREDPRAVMELVAMVPAGQTSDSATTFKRAGGEWVADPDIMQDFRSATPPPTILLDDEQLESVLSQVDSEPDPEEGEDPGEGATDPTTASGQVIKVTEEHGQVVLSLVSAGGADRNRGNAEALRRYWTTGKGGLKIRWNTGGDWRRCVRQLSKHLGPGAKGYCFTGDTEFITRDGMTTFEEAAGTSQLVLTGDNPEGGPAKKSGHWVEAPIVSFGEQPVMTITLRRGKLRKQLRATPEHKWFASRQGRNTFYTKKADTVTTAELTPGMVLASLQPKWVTKNTVPSEFGIAAGLVFGDGAVEANGAMIDLWGEKNLQFEKYFANASRSPRKLESGVQGLRVRGLPKSWKAAPSLEEGPQYLLGWLAGYIAADGTVSSKGNIILSSARRADLELVARIAGRLGMTTHPIQESSRIGLRQTEAGQMFKISFARETVSPQMLISSEHRAKFEASKVSPAPVRWTVESVEDHGEREEVFCAVVPGTESFALADYIWTHNCALRHKEMTGMWPGDRRNRKEFTMEPNGAVLSSLDSLRREPAVIRAAGYAAQVDTAIAKVRGDEFIPVPVNAEDINGGRTGLAFKIPIVVPEGLSSGDKRHFRKGALGIRTLPLPLLWQPFTGEGHNGSPIVGRIDHVERTEAGLGNAYGVFDTGPYGREAQRLVENGMLRWVSVDLDKFEVDEAGTEADPDGKMHIRKGRMMGATLVSKPAFQECTLELLPVEGEMEDPMTIEASPLTASAGISEAIPVEPPDAWFERPVLNGPTPIRVTDEGQVFGHVATWTTSHVGLPGSTRPPRSGTDYAYFHTGLVRTAGGKDVKVGQLTLAGGHADLSNDAVAAAKHYDDTASALADVHAGEDSYGIWVAGALRPGTTPEQVRAFRASAPSGDWRFIEGVGLEMIAVCQVNVPGFPVPQSLAASGHTNALVAAGTADLIELRKAQADQNQEAMAAAAKQRVFMALDIDGYLSEFKDFPKEKRDELAKDGKALKDGSFPIENVADLRRAVKAYGRTTKEKQPKVRRHIVKRARALGKTELIPDHWREASLSDSQLSARDQVANLVADARARKVQELADRVNRPKLEAQAAELAARIKS